MNLYKYVTQGVNAKEFFNYEGNPLPIRPLTTYEMDQVFLKVIKEGITQTIFDSLIKVKLNLVASDEKIKVKKSDFFDFVNFYNELDYWMVYFAVKDFQEDFEEPDFKGEFKNDFDDWSPQKPRGYYIVRKMQKIHDIAEKIKGMTTAPTDALVEFIRNAKGQLLASIIYRAHVPLASEAWKLTPLQTKFLLNTRPDGPVILKDKGELPGVKAGMTVKEVFKLFGVENRCPKSQLEQ